MLGAHACSCVYVGCTCMFTCLCWVLMHVHIYSVLNINLNSVM